MVQDAKPYESFGIFRCEEDYFAIDTCHIREVVPRQPLTPLIGEACFVIGSFWLRGQVIPVIDFRSMSVGGFAETSDSQTAVVVVVFEKKLVGIVISEVVSLAQDKGFELSLFSQREYQLTTGHCFENEHKVDALILNVAGLFARMDIPYASLENEIQSQNGFAVSDHDSGRMDVFLMKLGQRYITVQANKVHSCLTIHNIKQPKVKSEFLLGEMDYLGMTVPLVDSVALFFDEENQSEHIEGKAAFSLVNSEGQMTVFVVDEIINIESATESCCCPLPATQFVGKQWCEKLIDISDFTGRYTSGLLAFHLDVNLLITSERTRSLAVLCRAVKTEDGIKSSISTMNQNMQPVESSTPLLLFERCGLFAIQLSHIIEIKMANVPISPLPDPHVSGLFKFGDTSLALHEYGQFCDSAIDGESVQLSAEKRILIVGDNQGHCAFIVDRLVDICNGQQVPSGNDSDDDSHKFNHFLLTKQGKNKYIKCVSLPALLQQFNG